MRARGRSFGKLLSIKCLRSSKPDMEMCTEIRGLPSSNDLINPFYVLSWRRLRRAGNAGGGCGDLGPAACLRLSRRLPFLTPLRIIFKFK